MRFVAIAMLGVLASVCAAAQEIRVVDLTGTAQSTRPDLMAVRTPTGVKREDLSCGPTQASAMRVRASLEWLETTVIHPKQRIEMLVRIENVGVSPIDVPIAAQFEDMQPTRSATPFEYLQLMLPLEAGLPSGGNLLGWLVLYGSTSKPDTLLSLKPGQSLRVRGKVFINRWYATDQAVTALTTFRLSRNVSPGDDGKSGALPEGHCVKVITGTRLPATVKAIP